jgi:hypothetical protein
LDSVIFSDESTIYLFHDHHGGLARPGEPVQSGKRKKTTKFNIWGAISYNAKSKLVIFEQNLNAEFYAKIIEENLLSFMTKRNIFQQDNRRLT